MGREDYAEWDHTQSPLFTIPNVLTLIFLMLTLVLTLFLIFINQINTRAVIQLPGEGESVSPSVLERLLTLETKEAQYQEMEARIQAREAFVTEQREKAAEILSIRSRIASELQIALSDSGLSYTLDPQSGTIRFLDNVFFEAGQDLLLPGGQDSLDRFIPVYLSVLLHPKYEEVLSEIIIEGHTYDVGNYLANLDLSQRRAAAVAAYVIALRTETSDADPLFHYLSASGRSFSQPVMENGLISQQLSRRVEFRFRLHEEGRMQELYDILKGADS